MCAILLFGLVAYRALPVAALPNVDYPTIQVSAALPGASPETMAASVATPLEREFSTLAGIQQMSSSSSQSSTTVTVQFTLDRNIDAAAQDIQAAISKAGGNLPHDDAAAAVVSESESGRAADAVPGDELVDAADVHGGRVRRDAAGGSASRWSAAWRRCIVYGAQKYAVRVQLDPDLMADAGHRHGRSAAWRSRATTSTCRSARLDGAKQAFTVDANGQLENAAAYRPVIVAYRNGVAGAAGATGAR